MNSYELDYHKIMNPNNNAGFPFSDVLFHKTKKDLKQGKHSIAISNYFLFSIFKKNCY